MPSFNSVTDCHALLIAIHLPLSVVMSEHHGSMNPDKRGKVAKNPKADGGSTSKGKGRAVENPKTVSEEPTVMASAVWTEDDEDKLIAFLNSQKEKRGDGGNFKPSTWTAAAAHMQPITTKGGVKTADACKTKWARVHCYILPFSQLF